MRLLRQRLQQRIFFKEGLGRPGALLRCGHGPALLCRAGSQLLFADADIAACLFHRLAGSFPGGFAGLLFPIQLLQQRVLPAVGQLLGLCLIVGLGGSKGVPALPQPGQRFQCAAAQDVLVLVVGRFQRPFGLHGLAASFTEARQLLFQRTGAGAAGVQTDVPLGRRRRSSRNGWWRSRSRVALSGKCSSVSGVSQQTMRRRIVSAYCAASGFSLST
mgnify:CR=1 FL=1